MAKCTPEQLAKGYHDVPMHTKTGKSITACRPSAILIKGKSAYREPKGYKCTGPHGPPYGHKIGADYSEMFAKIENNIREKSSDAVCFKGQALNLFNIMKKDLGAKGLKMKATVEPKVGSANLNAYCSVLKAYRDASHSGRESKSKYCS